MDPREPRLSALLGKQIVTTTPLGGASLLRLADGTEVVAKGHAHETAVLAEAAGLRWLADACRCPRVVAHDEEWLVI